MFKLEFLLMFGIAVEEAVDYDIIAADYVKADRDWKKMKSDMRRQRRNEFRGRRRGRGARGGRDGCRGGRGRRSYGVRGSREHGGDNATHGVCEFQNGHAESGYRCGRNRKTSNMNRRQNMGFMSQNPYDCLNHDFEEKFDAQQRLRPRRAVSRPEQVHNMTLDQNVSKATQRDAKPGQKFWSAENVDESILTPRVDMCSPNIEVCSRRKRTAEIRAPKQHSDKRLPHKDTTFAKTARSAKHTLPGNDEAQPGTRVPTLMSVALTEKVEVNQRKGSADEALERYMKRCEDDTNYMSKQMGESSFENPAKFEEPFASLGISPQNLLSFNQPIVAKSKAATHTTDAATLESERQPMMQKSSMRNKSPHPHSERTMTQPPKPNVSRPTNVEGTVAAHGGQDLPQYDPPTPLQSNNKGDKRSAKQSFQSFARDETLVNEDRTHARAHEAREEDARSDYAHEPEFDEEDEFFDDVAEELMSLPPLYGTRVPYFLPPAYYCSDPAAHYEREIVQAAMDLAQQPQPSFVSGIPNEDHGIEKALASRYELWSCENIRCKC